MKHDRQRDHRPVSMVCPLFLTRAHGLFNLASGAWPLLHTTGFRRFSRFRTAGPGAELSGENSGRAALRHTARGEEVPMLMAPPAAALCGPVRRYGPRESP
ncbi:hypothetical protein SSPO_080210 [Streptomyces antimycoticus]|uniref:Uncharacterized protein n=1 Tax=Streptomyces antimycoticus TaxID=68175 RepID=A0A499UTH3_9ACTN|nr:hypothetical protein SSPO_080210 [Streptomyces antimycoticus]